MAFCAEFNLGYIAEDPTRCVGAVVGLDLGVGTSWILGDAFRMSSLRALWGFRRAQTLTFSLVHLSRWHHQSRHVDTLRDRPRRFVLELTKISHPQNVYVIHDIGQNRIGLAPPRH